jgi:hypothetical protein
MVWGPRSGAPPTRHTWKLRHIQGYLAHKKATHPRTHQRALGTVLLQGPKRALLLMSEVPRRLDHSSPGVRAINRKKRKDTGVSRS